MKRKTAADPQARFVILVLCLIIGALVVLGITPVETIESQSEGELTWTTPTLVIQARQAPELLASGEIQGELYHGPAFEYPDVEDERDIEKILTPQEYGSLLGRLDKLESDIKILWIVIKDLDVLIRDLSEIRRKAR